MTEKKDISKKSKTKPKAKAKAKPKAKQSKIIIENIINVARGRGGGGRKKLNEQNKGLEYNYTTFIPRQQPNIIQYQEPQSQPPPPPPMPQSRLDNNEPLIRELARLKQEKLLNDLARPYIEQRNILEQKRNEDRENIKKSYMDRLPTLSKDYYDLELEEKSEVMNNQARELIETLNQEKPVRKTSIPPLEDLPQPQPPVRRNIRLIKRTKNQE